ncbi:hypothetical protein HY990_01465 [Candidatus Micrarchaeota archaeon]|nr:hypothetical protein [Candidatus Micrarchaeota archaeon]
MTQLKEKRYYFHPHAPAPAAFVRNARPLLDGVASISMDMLSITPEERKLVLQAVHPKLNKKPEGRARMREKLWSMFEEGREMGAKEVEAYVGGTRKTLWHELAISRDEKILMGLLREAGIERVDYTYEPVTREIFNLEIDWIIKFYDAACIEIDCSASAVDLEKAIKEKEGAFTRLNLARDAELVRNLEGYPKPYLVLRGFNHKSMAQPADDKIVIIVDYPNYYDGLPEDRDGKIAIKFELQDRLVKLVDEHFRAWEERNTHPTKESDRITIAKSLETFTRCHELVEEASQRIEMAKTVADLKQVEHELKRQLTEYLKGNNRTR